MAPQGARTACAPHRPVQPASQTPAARQSSPSASRRPPCSRRRTARRRTPCIRLHSTFQSVRTAVRPRASQRQLAQDCVTRQSAKPGGARTTSMLCTERPSTWGSQANGAHLQSRTSRSGGVYTTQHARLPRQQGKGATAAAGPALSDSRPGLLQGRVDHARLRGLDKRQRRPAICRHPLRAAAAAAPLLLPHSYVGYACCRRFSVCATGQQAFVCP